MLLRYTQLSLAAKLKAARVRKHRESGIYKGRKPPFETNLDSVREARRLRRAIPATARRKRYQRVANELFELGFMTAKGKPCQQDSIYQLLV